MITSRDLGDFVSKPHVRVESRPLSRHRGPHECRARGLPPCHGSPTRPGTINLAVITDAPLGDTALIELSSIATQARTAAVMDHGPDLAKGAPRAPGPIASPSAPPGTGPSQASIPRSARPWAPPSTAPWPAGVSNGWPNRGNPGCPGAMSCYMARHARPRPHLERQKRYPGTETSLSVLDDVSLGLARGETLALTGESGSGKSTLLHLAGGLDAPDAGHVRLMGHDLSTLSDAARARIRGRHAGLVFPAVQPCAVADSGRQYRDTGAV
jgi:ABC-type multidrug transport system fused ATPase/permease subunit